MPKNPPQKTHRPQVDIFKPQADSFKNATMFTLRLANVSWLQGLLLVVAGLVLNLIHLCVALFTAFVFYSVLRGDEAEQTLPFVIALIAALVIRPLAQLGREWVIADVTGRIKTRLRQTMWQTLVDRGPMRMHGVRQGRVLSLMSDGVESLEPYVGKYLPQVAVAAITCTAVCGVIFPISPTIAIVLLVSAAATFTIPRLWDRVLAEKGHEHWDAYAQLNGKFLDSMAGMATLKSFNAGPRRHKELNDKASELLRKTMSQLRLGLGETGVSTLVALLGPALALTIGVQELRSGDMTSVQLLLVVLLSREAIRPVQELASCWHAGMFGLSTTYELHDLYRQLQQKPTYLQPDSGGSKAADLKSGAEFDGNDIHVAADVAATFTQVSYSYHNATKLALDNVNWSLQRGKTTALIGGSGSGKSTMIGLLCGLDTAQHGTIDIQASTISLVAQDPVIFAGTVAQSLRHVRPNAPDDDLIDALEMAQFTLPTVSSTRAVLSYELDEMGANISGGQRQRLAIARALLAQPDFLVLDEATSALDSATELAVLEAIRTSFPAITLLLITHRLDVASSCDEVAVLVKGKIVDCGHPQTISCADLELTKI